MSFIYSDEVLQGGMSMGGYPLGGKGVGFTKKTKAGFTKFQEVLKRIEKLGHKKPRKVYSSLKAMGHDVSDLSKMSPQKLKEAISGLTGVQKTVAPHNAWAHKPKKGAKQTRSPPGLYLAERVKTLPDSEKIELAKWLHARGHGMEMEGAGFWDTLGDIASAAAPFVPLLL